MRSRYFAIPAIIAALLLNVTAVHAFFDFWPFGTEEELYSLAAPRDYHAAPTPEEKKAIAFIVTTLADTPVPKIIFYKSELEASGALIDRVHPLRFLMVVFTDEQLKVGIKNMKRKGGLPWKNFSNGLYGGLQDESNLTNMQEAFVVDFCQIVQVKPEIIYPLIQQDRWDDLIETLIACLPRKGDYRRYDY